MSEVPTAETLLDLRSVGVSVKTTTLISDVDLQIERGGWLSIVGPNGAGKSTLLRAIASGSMSHGSITMDGTDLATLGTKERAALISWVPQTRTIPIGMNVLDYVLLGRTPHLHPLASPRADDIALAESIIEDLDLVTLAGRQIETLSGGERQRAVIGRALAQEAPLLLLDEPTSALDLGHQQDVLALLNRLRGNGDRAIVTTMHDLTLAGAFADELVMMNAGRIVERGGAGEVLTEANIADYYGANVRVETIDGTVLVVPRLDSSSTNPDSSKEHP